MANIIEFPKDVNGFTFERAAGYNIVPGNIIGDYFTHARGSGTDLFVVRIYSETGTIKEICRGYVPTGEVTNAIALRQKQIELGVAMDQAFEDAESVLCVKPNGIYQKHTDEGYDVLFVNSDNGFFSCGWYDNAGTARKGLKMAAFMVYVYGFINSEDKRLWETAYKFLPYDTELGRADVADEIIIEGLRALIIDD